MDKSYFSEGSDKTKRETVGKEDWIQLDDVPLFTFFS